MAKKKMYWEDGTMYRATRVTYPEPLPENVMIAGAYRRTLTSGWLCCCRDCQIAVKQSYREGVLVWIDYMTLKAWEKRIKLRNVNSALDRQ